MELHHAWPCGSITLTFPFLKFLTTQGTSLAIYTEACRHQCTNSVQQNKFIWSRWDREEFFLFYSFTKSLTQDDVKSLFQILSLDQPVHDPITWNRSSLSPFLDYKPKYTSCDGIIAQIKVEKGNCIQLNVTASSKQVKSVLIQFLTQVSNICCYSHDSEIALTYAIFCIMPEYLASGQKFFFPEIGSKTNI